MSRSETALWAAAAALLAAIAAVGAYKYQRAPTPPEQLAYLAPDPACNLHQGPCKRTLPGGARVSLGIDPRPIPVITPLTIVADIDGLNPRQVVIDFSGVDMDMGVNRFPLQADGPGHYRGTGVLPVCVRNRMAWRARLQIVDDSGVRTVEYRFNTVRP